nr:MAG TPA: hypothetical protein [Caudoviricetes sp.]
MVRFNFEYVCVSIHATNIQTNPLKTNIISLFSLIAFLYMLYNRFLLGRNWLLLQIVISLL